MFPLRAFTCWIIITGLDPHDPVCKTLHLSISFRKTSSGKSCKSVRQLDHPVHTNSHTVCLWIATKVDNFQHVHLSSAKGFCWAQRKGRHHQCTCVHTHQAEQDCLSVTSTAITVDMFFFCNRNSFNHKSKILLSNSTFHIYQKGCGKIFDLQSVNTSIEKSVTWSYIINCDTSKKRIK